MNLQVVYCNHQTARLGVRERIAFANEDQLARAYDELRNRFPASEYVVVSTCNRVELYTAQEKAEDAPSHADLARFFSEFHQVPLSEFFDDLLEQTGPEAVRHLFQVASSIDSMVLGESQIVSQVKQAYECATRSQANGPLTNALFQRAMTVSARVRSETKLVEGRVSIASVAVGEFGKSIFDRFDDKTVVILGAGEMAEETLRYLKNEGVGRILVSNRSPERARRVADEFGGEPRPWESLDDCLAEADVIVSTTGATEPIVDGARFERIRKRSRGRSVFILDLGAPRDFAPDVGEVDDNVFLYDIDNLEATCERNRRARVKEIERAHGIIEEETARFMQDVYHKATGPIIKRLRETWHDVSRQEMETLFKKLSHLDDKDRKQIERSVERVVNKLLHPPLETLRDEAKEGTPHGLLDAIRTLFHLRD
ncbi:glutamyl-tRNA reductase [Maioricimonas sp. JC845]|uniref:glutamyl-tRNA reductase n=1 Tax=Maioricimonas sp. JC845 TaxID=3232138 RepID=UPI003458E21F